MRAVKLAVTSPGKIDDIRIKHPWPRLREGIHHKTEAGDGVAQDTRDGRNDDLAWGLPRLITL